VDAAFDDRRCAACGAVFGCGAAIGSCWCTEVVLTPQALEVLRARHEGCLCQSCLAAAADASQSGRPL
jgi:Cysteine-rich CWC